MSARALSLAIGMSPSYISKVELGQIDPSLKVFSSIAKVLQMTDSEVLFLVRLS